MGINSPPTGASDVHDALIATQREPDYNSKGYKAKPVTQSEINNISGYVEKNIGTNVQKRYGEHR